jgi:hypothetical protein
MNKAPKDHSHLDVRVRQEMLVGHLADLLTPTRGLVSQFRLRANASMTTRSELEVLTDLTQGLWAELIKIRKALGETGEGEQ